MADGPTLNSVVADLRVMLGDHQEELDKVQARAKQLRAERDHIQRALDLLTGDTSKYASGGKRPAGRPAKGTEVQAVKRRYRPRQASLDQLVAVLRAADEPLAHGQLKELVDFSEETLTRALSTLRDEEVIRVAGAEGNRTLYALMPEQQVIEPNAALRAA